MTCRIALLFFLLGPLTMWSQIESTTISVGGRAVYVDPSPVYKAVVSLSNSLLGGSSERKELDELVMLFKEDLRKNGIPWSQITKNPYTFGYEVLGYQDPGNIYQFTTESVASMISFLDLKTPGLQKLNSVSEISIDQDEAKSIMRAALDNAQQKAQIIAETMGKELGEIIKIEAHNDIIGQPYESSMYYDRPPGEFVYVITVLYGLE